MKSMLIGLFSFFMVAHWSAFSQTDIDSLIKQMESMQERISQLESAELVQSMSQRSLVIPGYHAELKALLAKQAYAFWKKNDQDKLVSHVNVYAALYYANKYLGYDSLHQRYFNQVFGHNESVISIQFGTDPDIFYSAGSDGRVLQWNINQPEKIPNELYRGNHLIRSLDVSADGKWLLIVTREQGIKLVSTSQNTLEQLPIIHDNEFSQSAIFLPRQSKNFPTYLTVDLEGRLHLKGLRLDSIMGNTEGKVLAMEYNTRDLEIYTGMEEGYFSSWDRISQRKFFIKENYAIRSMAISPDMRLLAIGREKGDAILWDLEAEKELRIISGHQSAITDLDFSPSGNQLLTASRDGTVRVWDLEEPRRLPIILDDHNNWVMTAAFAPDGKRIVSGARDNIIRVWNVDMEVLAKRICTLVERNLSQDEWEQYIGRAIPFEQTCP